MPSKSSKSKRKSSKRTTLKQYEVAMLLSACGGGHVNPKDAVDEARGYLVGMPCPTGMVKTKTGGCRQKRKTKPRKTKPRKKLTKEDCKDRGKVLNKKTGRCNQKKRKTKPRKKLTEEDCKNQGKVLNKETGKCNKPKTKRRPSMYNLFVREAMQLPEVRELRSNEAKMLAVGNLWRQPGVKEGFYADKGVPMPSRRKTLAEREVECKAAGKRWTGKRCITQKLTADEDDAAQEHDPNWWLKQGYVPPMWDEEADAAYNADDFIVNDDSATWVDTDLQNEYGIQV